MGAISKSMTFPAQTEAELKSNVNAAIKEAVEDCEHEGYRGTIARSYGVRIISKVFSNYNDAEQWIMDNHKKYEPMLAVRVGNMDKSVRFSKTGKVLAEKINTMQIELNNYEKNYFSTQKRDFMCCTSCGSKINRLTLLKKIDFYGDCPVCNQTFIPESILSKKQELSKKLEVLKNTMEEKMSKEKDKIMWVVGGWMAT